MEMHLKKQKLHDALGSTWTRTPVNLLREKGGKNKVSES